MPRTIRASRGAQLTCKNRLIDPAYRPQRRLLHQHPQRRLGGRLEQRAPAFFDAALSQRDDQPAIFAFAFRRQPRAQAVA